jgi:hypothetical protein
VHPLWDKVIAPVLEAAAVRRVVEIGALAGETTVKLLDLLGDQAEVHVIDPAPQFDPSEHERRFPGRYHFHRDTSHNVLPTLPAVDAALIDGDHNWYTVYNELKMLAATAREAGAPLPLLFMHDVGWPYGRRDLYYAPERIPEEFRHPYARKGLRLRMGGRGRSALLERGGFNARMNNAVREGGPRNGVMTALEDFAAEHDRQLRVVVLPIYFSLAIAAEEELIATRPDLAEAFDRLERPEFLRQMLELSERLRIREMHWGQVVFYQWQDRLERAARQYLDLLKADLPEPPDDLDRVETYLETIRTDKVEGDLVQCGTAGADATILMRGFAQAHELRSPNVWVADGRSPDGNGRPGVAEGPGSQPSLEDVRERLRRFELLDERVKPVSGPLRTTLAEAPIEKVALLRVGADAEPGAALDLLYDKVTLGGYVLVDGCTASGRREAVDDFRASRGVDEAIEQIDSGSAGWRKVG